MSDEREQQENGAFIMQQNIEEMGYCYFLFHKNNEAVDFSSGSTQLDAFRQTDFFGFKPLNQRFGLMASLIKDVIAELRVSQITLKYKLHSNFSS